MSQPTAHHGRHSLLLTISRYWFPARSPLLLTVSARAPRSPATCCFLERSKTKSVGASEPNANDPDMLRKGEVAPEVPPVWSA